LERSFCFPEGMDSGLIHKNKSIRKNAKGMDALRIIILAIMLSVMVVPFWQHPVLASDSDKINKLHYFNINSISVEDIREILEKKLSKTEEGTQKRFSGVEKIENAAQFASSITGVRKDFLMGMLVVESNLGKNVGKCSYAQVEQEVRRKYDAGLIGNSTWRTFQKRKNILDNILLKLDRNPSDTFVSCNPSGYRGTGGAMGIAQFMPDTWLEYEERIAGIVGKEKPDPWNIRDGVVPDK